MCLVFHCSEKTLDTENSTWPKSKCKCLQSPSMDLWYLVFVRCVCMFVYSADIALIGLAVMGQNLILNMNDHGFVVSLLSSSHLLRNSITSFLQLITDHVMCHSMSSPASLFPLKYSAPAVARPCLYENYWRVLVTSTHSPQMSLQCCRRTRLMVLINLRLPFPYYKRVHLLRHTTGTAMVHRSTIPPVMCMPPWFIQSCQHLWYSLPSPMRTYTEASLLKLELTSWLLRR